jgi:hypothetical protein
MAWWHPAVPRSASLLAALFLLASAATASAEYAWVPMGARLEG